MNEKQAHSDSKDDSVVHTEHRSSIATAPTVVDGRTEPLTGKAGIDPGLASAVADNVEDYQQLIQEAKEARARRRPCSGPDWALWTKVWVYYRLPEPRNRSFGELDVLFAQGVSARKFGSTSVYQSEAVEAEEVENKEGSGMPGGISLRGGRLGRSKSTRAEPPILSRNPY